VSIGRHGVFQDGAMRNPNPTGIAMEEITELYDRKTRRDLVLSLGTGLRPPDTSLRDWTYSDLLIDCLGLRLVRWSRERLREALDAEVVHLEVSRMFKTLDSRSASRYHRVNPELPDGLPRLDDAASMESMMAGVQHCYDVAQLSEIKMSLIASSFYFELVGPPTRGRADQFRCSGAIRIRGDPQHVCELVRTVSTDLVHFIKNKENVANVQLEEERCSSCGRFNLPIKFTVPEIESNVTISIRLGVGQEHHISGFPQAMDWFITQQRLDDPFTHPCYPPDPCPCRMIRRKRPSSRRTLESSGKRARVV